jgi:hypothetical protein
MRTFTWTSIVVLLGIAGGSAENLCAHTSPLTGQGRLVRREIQSRIDESIEADEAKDLVAKMEHSAPDLTLKLVDGTVLDRKQIEEGVKRDADWILSVSDQTNVTIECIELKGKEAVLITDQHFVRTVPDRKDGSPHELITHVKHRETWIYTQKGWLTKRIDELTEGPVYLDGKLYEK